MANPEIQIEPAAPGDADSIFALLQELDQYERQFLPEAEQRERDRTSPDEAELRQRQRQQISEFITQQDGRKCLVARAAGTIVGYAMARFTESPLTPQEDGPVLRTSVLHQLVVTAAFRRQQVGTQLESGVTRWATGIRAQRQYLITLEANHPARAFYRRRGYVEIPPDDRFADVMFEKNLVAIPGQSPSTR